MAKSEQRIKARLLRGKGESIKAIAKLLTVSPGSVSVWCKDVKLSQEQIEALEKRFRDPHYGRRLSYSIEQQKKKFEKMKMLLQEGIEDIGNLTQRELFLTGAALYWAEGFKKDSQAGLASMDPSMINFFLKWLNACFGYKHEDLIVRVTLNTSHKHRVKEVEKYWSGVTGIPINQFRKPFFQKFVWKKVYENPNNYFGVLRVKVRKSTDFLRKIQGYIEGLRLQSKIR